MKLTFLFILLSWLSNANSQVLKNAHILTLDSAELGQNNSKLINEFSKIFKHSDLVVMSEPTHSEGTTLEVESEIIKGLISTHQINSLYLESSWVNIERIKRILTSGGKESIKSTYKYCGTGFLMDWVRTGFWDYLANAFISREVDIIGFDIEPTTTNCVYEMFLRAWDIPYLDSLRIKNPKQFDALNLSLFLYDQFGFLLSFERTQFEELESVCSAAHYYWIQNKDSVEAESWRQISTYFAWIFSRQDAGVQHDYFTYADHTDIHAQALFNSTRDSLMAANFLREYSRRSDSKAVILTSAYHSMRNVSNETELQSKKLGNPKFIFGEILNDSLRKPYFNLLFIGGSGFRGNENWKRKIKVNSKSELGFFKQFDEPFIFANFQGTNLRDTCFKLKFPIATINEFSIKAYWARIFDGIFYIKTMHPKLFKKEELGRFDLNFKNR